MTTRVNAKKLTAPTPPQVWRASKGSKKGAGSGGHDVQGPASVVAVTGAATEHKVPFAASGVAANNAAATVATAGHKVSGAASGLAVSGAAAPAAAARHEVLGAASGSAVSRHSVAWVWECRFECGKRHWSRCCFSITEFYRYTFRYGALGQVLRFGSASVRSATIF